tara:strand:+ start:788 stop:1729 length:942 start_codon:yes stop_codon:yes gene_type:complete
LKIANFLNKFSKDDSLNHIVQKLCESAITITKGIHNDDYEIEQTTKNIDGDTQKPLDIFSDRTLLNSLKVKDVAGYCSEEQEGLVSINEDGKFVVVTDPLDGSSNIEANVSIGTIFSIFPTNGLKVQEAIFQQGNKQACSGFFVYGPRTTFFLTFKKGTHSFFLNYNSNQFELLQKDILIPESTSEYSINSSYKRFWNKKVLNYIQNCQQGLNGPRKKDFNMRWVGSLVADASRIFSRGGIFLYPEDTREKNKNGRLRLTYEANPIALLIEQAGGRATDGKKDILNIDIEKIHQRTPFIFGSKEEVDTFLNTE